MEKFQIDHENLVTFWRNSVWRKIEPKFMSVEKHDQYNIMYGLI